MAKATLNALDAPNSWELIYINDNWVTVKCHLIIPQDAKTTEYPVILFGHGAGQAGSNLSSIYNSPDGGPAYYNTIKKWKGGAIVITPQAGTWSPAGKFFQDILDWVIQNYKVDKTRISWIGISAGGKGMIDYNLSFEMTPKYAISAYVALAVVANSYDINKGKKIAADNTKWWGIYDINDGNGQQTRDWGLAIDANKKGLTRTTLHNEGHTFYRLNPDWIDPVSKLNIYDWAMQQKSGVAAEPIPVPTPTPAPEPTPIPVPVPAEKKLLTTITVVTKVYTDGTSDTTTTKA